MTVTTALLIISLAKTGFFSLHEEILKKDTILKIVQNTSSVVRSWKVYEKVMTLDTGSAHNVAGGSCLRNTAISEHVLCNTQPTPVCKNVVAESAHSGHLA